MPCRIVSGEWRVNMIGNFKKLGDNSNVNMCFASLLCQINYLLTWYLGAVPSTGRGATLLPHTLEGPRQKEEKE